MLSRKTENKVQLISTILLVILALLVGAVHRDRVDDPCVSKRNL